MTEFRSTIFFSVLVIFIAVILIAAWHSISEGAVTEAGLGPSATPMPTTVSTGGTTLQPSQHRDAHLIPAPDVAEIPTAGREYQVSLTVYDSIDLAITNRALRFQSLRTGETAVDTGHGCEAVAVREVLVTREGSITTLTARLDRDTAETGTLDVYFRLLGPGTNLSEVAEAAGYEDVDQDGTFNEGDVAAALEASVAWNNLVGGQRYTVYASDSAGYPAHQTRGTSWTVGRESEAIRDPVVASRIHAPAGSHVTLSSCQQGASAELLLLDGESMAAHGNGGTIIRIYGLETE